MIKNLTIRKKLSLGFSVPIVILLLVSTVSYNNTNNLISTAKWTAHTFEVLENAEIFLSTVKDLETGQRGYLLTGEERYLQPYTEALDMIYVTLNKIKQLTSDNPAQQERISRIKPLLKLKIDELAETIAIRKDVGFNAALTVVLSDRGKKVMDDMRIIMQDFMKEEFDLLVVRQVDSDSSASFAKVSIIIMALLSIALVAYITKTISGEILTPLLSAINIAKRVSNGDRNIDIDTSTQDETGDLLKALNSMQIAIKLTESKMQDSEELMRESLNYTTDTVSSYTTLISKIAEGDLREKLIIAGDDELAKLGGHLNSMTSSLSELAEDTRSVAEQITDTVSQVTVATNDQAASAHQQAGAISETTSTLKEVKQTSIQTLDKASLVGESADRSVQESKEGMLMVNQVIQGMNMIRAKIDDMAQSIHALSKQTQQIGDITEVVNGLSQQSKILALNASIEAAKAGEAGQGFAVVADEVKELADQSQQSTEQVQQILQDISQATNRVVKATEESIKGVDSGVNLVEKTGDVMAVLGDTIKETLTASQQIVAAVRQEVAGIDQVNIAMNEINSSVQQSVAATKQTKDANKNLGLLADELRRNVSVYKV